MTKDEFISKYHTQKILKFEPPTWEEFLATETENIFAHWFYDGANISIVMSRYNNRFVVINSYEQPYESEHFVYEYNEFLDNREEMYYKALDIAMKWFLGEEV